MQVPLAARIQEAIDGEHLQKVIPGGALAAGRQTVAPEVAELKQIPKLKGQPTGPPLARTVEAKLTQAHLHAVVSGVVGERSIIGEQGEGLRPLRDRIKGGDGAGPGGLLGIVHFTEVEKRSVHDAAVGDAALFHQGPITVFLAVFEARVAFEIHAGP
jgi:hypothetical protein